MKVSNDHRGVLTALWGGMVVYLVGVLVAVAGVGTSSPLPIAKKVLPPNPTAALQASANSLSLTGAPAELLQTCASILYHFHNLSDCTYPTQIILSLQREPPRPTLLTSSISLLFSGFLVFWNWSSGLPSLSSPSTNTACTADGPSFSRFWHPHRLFHTKSSIVRAAYSTLYPTNTPLFPELLFFSRQAPAQQLFGAERLNTALAGVIIIAIGNGVTAIALGLVEVRVGCGSHCCQFATIAARPGPGTLCCGCKQRCQGHRLSSEHYGQKVSL